MDISATGERLVFVAGVLGLQNNGDSNNKKADTGSAKNIQRDMLEVTTDGTRGHVTN